MISKKLLSFILTTCVLSTSLLSTISVRAQTIESIDSQTAQLVLKKTANGEQTKSQTKEFVIKNNKDFSKFMTKSKYWENDNKITLTCDINMKGKVFNPIKSFYGVFDGCGHIVSNISFKGCFVETNLGTISRLNLKNSKLVNGVNGGRCSFVVDNYKSGVIDSCSVDMHSEGKIDIPAGFVCVNRGRITNSETTLSVKRTNYYNNLLFLCWNSAGGFVGLNCGTITCCTSKGDVTGTYYVGGFVGLNEGSMNNCSATGNVNGNVYVGGFVGWNNGSSYDYTYGNIYNCSATGPVIGNGYVGGFVGCNCYKITSCIAAGNVNGDSISLDKFAGENFGNIKDCKIA